MLRYDQLLQVLALEEDPTRRAFLWSEADHETWLRLLEENPEQVSLIALNKRLPASIIRILAVHTDEEVRSAIAMKRGTPGDVLIALAEDPVETVRQRVACNAKAPGKALEVLAGDPVCEISQTASERLASRCVHH